MRTKTVLLLLALSSCAYNSDYVARNDGRARIVWARGGLTSKVPVTNPACRDAVQAYVDWARANPEARLAQSGQPVEFWTGVRLDYPLVVNVPADHTHYASPPAFHDVAGGAVHSASAVTSGSKGGAVHSASAVSSGAKGGGGSHVGGGLDKDAVVVLAVVALVTLPVVAIGLAAANPENGGAVSSSIDVVNAYNDLTRMAGSPCSNMTAPAMSAEPTREVGP
jgi:hypothetical protein